MYRRPEEFGGSLFSLAVSVMTDLIHHEPQSFRQLNEAGLPAAFLDAIKVRHTDRAGDGTRARAPRPSAMHAHAYVHTGSTARHRCCKPPQLLPALLTQAGVLPSGDAIVSIPGALVALCLNTAGLAAVREGAALNVLLDIFTSKKAMRVLTSDTPAILGSGLEELLRCAALRCMSAARAALCACAAAGCMPAFG